MEFFTAFIIWIGEFQSLRCLLVFIMVIAQNFMQLDKPKTKQKKRRKMRPKYYGIYWRVICECSSMLIVSKYGAKKEGNQNR